MNIPTLTYPDILLLRAEDAIAIHVDVNTRIQILSTIDFLPSADKEQCGAFIVCLGFSLAIYFLRHRPA